MGNEPVSAARASSVAGGFAASPGQGPVPAEQDLREALRAMRGSARRAGRPPRRLARRLLGRNELRRHADRIETAVIASLVAAFLTAAVAAACFAGHLYQSEHTAAAGLRPAVAALLHLLPNGS
jgi:hypothetical protein